MLQTHHYVGLVNLGDTLGITFYTTNASGTPATPTVGPTYQTLGPTGDVMPNSSGTATNFASTTGLYRIEIIPTLANGYRKGQTYSVPVPYTCTIAKGEVFVFTVT